MPKFVVLALLLVPVFFALPARADLDYQCLNTCKNSGNPTASCMDECRLTVAAPINKKSAPEAGSATHKQFDAPVKASSVVLPVEKKKLETRTDYVCIQECLKGHLQYSLCQQRCTTVDKSTLPGDMQSSVPSAQAGR
ncbi:MAG: hypothetical protein EBV03_01885 [Proteobacteria bacterium]|nr:hypothetical protein [Pseudomonadota bacterium]